MPTQNQTNSQVKKTICPLDCPDSCSLLATVSDGKVILLQGDPDHPYTNGFICRKMRRYPERLYGSDRILYPQIRIGKKGEAKFRRISWEEALSVCSEKLLTIYEKYGGESILPYSYAGNMGLVNRFAGFPLFHRLNALQLEQTICSAAAKAGWEFHCGKLPGTPPENAAESDLIFAWGINIKVSNVHFWQYVAEARKNGTHLVVIDPYRNQTGKSADTFVQVRPGGDTGLALGLCKLLYEAGDYDKEFVEQWTTGFESLAQYLKERDIVEFVQESGIELDQMQQLADLLGKSSKTFFRIGIGLTRNSRGAMSVRSITSLAATLGLFRGGTGKGILLSSGAFGGDKERLIHASLQQKPARTVNMIHLGHALSAVDSKVRALVVYNANPLSVNPDAGSVRRGLAREDLFTIVHEQVMTPTAAYADLLLPATTFLENEDLYTGYGHFFIGRADPVIAPVGEAKSNFDFFQKLAKKMGFDDAPFAESLSERMQNYYSSIKELPGDSGEVKLLSGHYLKSTNSLKKGDYLLRHEQKFNFVHTKAPTLPAHACILPAMEACDPDLRSRFPLYMITPPHSELLNSTFGERFKDFSGELLIHPEDATKYKVGDGDEVKIKNHRGEVRRMARVTTDTLPGVVIAEGIFWPVAVTSNDESKVTGINDLTSQKVTDLGGGATFHESLVAIEPLSET